jgi:hypothetical protein
VINPMHHTNSTAITDWALRRPHSQLHLVQRYSTLHWRTLEQIANSSSAATRIITPMVSRHFDFLEGLSESGNLPVAKDKMQSTLMKLDVLIGSAPVGPSTVQKLLTYAGKLPHVRFGSTETCLQVRERWLKLCHDLTDSFACVVGTWDPFEPLEGRPASRL